MVMLMHCGERRWVLLAVQLKGFAASVSLKSPSSITKSGLALLKLDTAPLIFSRESR